MKNLKDYLMKESYEDDYDEIMEYVKDWLDLLLTNDCKNDSERKRMLKKLTKKDDELVSRCMDNLQDEFDFSSFEDDDFDGYGFEQDVAATLAELAEEKLK